MLCFAPECAKRGTPHAATSQAKAYTFARVINANCHHTNNGYVYELTISNNGLYVGGNFTQTGDSTNPNLGYIGPGTSVVTGETYIYLPLV
jgi:hypothetical protein